MVSDKNINNSTMPSANHNSFPDLKFCSQVLMSSNLAFIFSILASKLPIILLKKFLQENKSVIKFTTESCRALQRQVYDFLPSKTSQ